MSNSLNKVQLIGNMTAAPEVKETPNGQKVASFSIATNRKWKDASGVLQEETEYHPIVAWRGLADIVEQYTDKGKKVYVEGHLKTRSWDDAQGVKRWKTEIVADQLILLGGPNRSNDGRSNADEDSLSDFPEDDHQKKAREAREKKRRDTASTEISIEDIPF